ncbi:MAG: hypothetical protein GYA14_04520 [Ignavibacteria bacterium]|nr:hypothetical protein [Ignavibacteria bacterium]
MVIKRLLILVGVVVILLASIFLFISRNKNSRFTNDELAQYKSVYQEYPVQFLRKALNAYLEHDSSKACILEIAVKKSDGKEMGIDGITTGLDAFDKKYYSSKFVVATYDDSKQFEGSKDIQIIFRDKPDRIFYALVGRNPEVEICLLGFNSKDNIDQDALKEMIRESEPHFSDPELAI